MASDVLIIVGGVIGLVIARELHNRGVRGITILERGALGCEASWAAAGMLAPNVEVGSNPEFHRFCIASLELYPGLAEGLLDETGIDIELDRTGTLYLAFTDDDLAELNERRRRQADANLAVEHLTAREVGEFEPFIAGNVREGLFFPNDWQVENRKMLLALTKFAEVNQIRIVEHTNVSQLLVNGSRIVGARTPAGDHFAGTIVVATGAWTSLIKIGDEALPITVKPIRGQMIRFETGTRRIRRVVYSRRGYVVPRVNGDVLAGATVENAGFEKATTADGIRSITNGALEIAPRLAGFPVAEKWSGLRPFAADGLPVLGDIPGHEAGLIATAHYRNGILLAPKTAEIVAAKILDGVSSKFFGIFGADRFSARANVMTK